MGAGVFHGRVRDGNGCINPAIATRPPNQRSWFDGWIRIGLCIRLHSWLMVLRAVPNEWLCTCIGEKELDRAISIVRLSELPHVHPRPIDVMVYHGPQGRPSFGVGFPLRCFQRLSRPHLATQLCSWRNNWCTRGTFIPVLSY